MDAHHAAIARGEDSSIYFSWDEKFKAKFLRLVVQKFHVAWHRLEITESLLADIPDVFQPGTPLADAADLAHKSKFTPYASSNRPTSSLSC